MVIPGCKYFLATIILDDEMKKSRLFALPYNSKEMWRKARGYVISTAREIGERMSELNIRETTAEVVSRCKGES